MLDDDFVAGQDDCSEVGAMGGAASAEEEALQSILVVAVVCLGLLYLALRLAVRPAFEHGDAVVSTILGPVATGAGVRAPVAQGAPDL